MYSTIVSHQGLWLKAPSNMDMFLVLSDHLSKWKSFVYLLELALYAKTQIYLEVMI